jgi:3-methyladenine DNA glycosylase/8-oxoguanine DNA glycosylase
MLARDLHLPSRINLRLTLGPLAHAGVDPSIRTTNDEAVKATRTPDGPATLKITCSGESAKAEAWGPGAAWMLERSHSLIGAGDDPAAFRPAHPMLARLHKSRPGLRIPRTSRVMEMLLPTIVAQRVTSIEAHRSWGRLARAFGEPAPGPAGLLLPPDPAVLATLPYYEFHRHGVERNRADTIRRACRGAARLEETETMEPAGARNRLQAVAGIGPWTAGSVTMVTHGDPDAVIVGDYHIPHMVSWALAGEPRGDDVRMLELLRPYKGQRGRVIRLLKTTGVAEPAFGPRRRLRSIERI